MRISLIVWVAAIVVLSLLPLPYKAVLGTIGRWHTVGHFIMFFVTVLLAGWPVRSQRLRWTVALLVLAFGVVMEGAESFLYRNLFEWNDVTTDGCGVLAGTLLLSVVNPLRGAS